MNTHVDSGFTILDVYTIYSCTFLHAWVSGIAMASDIQQYQKHCTITIYTQRRKFEYDHYGGRDPALEAAQHALKLSKKLFIEYDTLNRKPVERKKLVVKNFGSDSWLPNKSIGVVREQLIFKLVMGKIEWFEASVSEVAMKAAQHPSSKNHITLTFDDSCCKFTASLVCDGDAGSSMSKQFDKVGDARNWLLSMGKSSEARFGKNRCIYVQVENSKHLQLYDAILYTYIYIYIHMLN